MSNLTLSFELISLINWLMENKKEEVTQLIDHAVKNGCIKLDQQGERSGNNLWAHQTIQDFVDFLEKTLKDTIERTDLLEAELREQLSELANNVDLSSFDDVAILRGFKQAKSQISKINIPESSYQPHKTFFKEVLMQRILENWQPNSAAAEA